jgi:hypothetical protein
MAFLLACPSVFAQDDAFRKGIAAQKNGRWADVESAMREAIAKDPKESSRKIGGLLIIGGEEYVPYFLLGEALFRRMDCGGALTAWEESDRQGIARKNATRARTIETGYAQCEAKGYLVGTKFAKGVAEARAVYSAANAEYAALTREIEAYPDVKTDGVARSNARSRISEARTRLASGESTRRAEDLAAVRTLSESATRLIRSAREVITTAVAGVESFERKVRDVETRLQQVDTAVRDFDAAIGTAPLKMTPSEPVRADRDRAVTLVGSARDRLRGADRAQGDADVAEATRLGDEATTLITRARTQFESEVTASVGAELAALQTSSADLFTQVEGRARTIEAALRERPGATELRSEFTKLQTQVTRAHRNFDRAIGARDLASARSAVLASSQLGPQFDDLATRLGIVKMLVLPDVLARAAQSLFDARYADVRATMTIETANSIEMPLRVHALVIRAAALFALYEYSGASDNALRAQARESADMGRRLDTSFRPNTAVFSPRFITFFLAPPESAR